MEDIRNLDELLRPHIGHGSVVIGQKSTKLTQPGENYGSLMKALEVTIKKADGGEETLQLVAKQIPSNPWLQDMFKVQHTFVKEMNLYAKVIPTLVEFQKEHGMGRTMDFFPRFFGGRKNLNASDVIDDDGVILLENLKVKGYTTWDRFTGFDLEGTRAVLKDLATFHAVPIAFKQQKPEEFEEKIAEHIRFVQLFDKTNEEIEQKFAAKAVMFAKQVEGSDEKNLAERTEKAFWHCLKTWAERFESNFNTIGHNDFWINNTMVKITEGKIEDNKMIDFQITDWSSLGKDVVFFLYSSVQMSVIENHYEDLVKFYHQNFIEVLDKLNCDTNLYTFEAFEEELSLAAKRSEFFHCVMMTKPIYAPPQKVKELDDMSEEDLIDDELQEGELRKAKFIIKEFAKRNWI